MKLMLPGNKELESNYMTHIVSVHISNTQPEFYMPILCSYLQKIKKSCIQLTLTLIKYAISSMII